MTAHRTMRQLVSYVFVGGAAALAEWLCFYCFQGLLGFHYLISTILSFIIATAVNYLLGKQLTFKHSEYGQTRAREILGVYAVSAAGLLLNVLLMYFFFSVLGLPGLLSKVIATGIVFFWNFLSRKFLIYKV